MDSRELSRVIKNQVEASMRGAIGKKIRTEIIKTCKVPGTTMTINEYINYVTNETRKAVSTLIASIIPGFRRRSIKSYRQPLDDHGVTTYIRVDKDELRRESLQRPDGTRTGDGIDDIVALFTHGYTLPDGSRPYGYWTHSHRAAEGNYINNRIGAKISRESNDFLERFVRKANRDSQRRYKVYLNDDYKINRKDGD